LCWLGFLFLWVWIFAVEFRLIRSTFRIINFILWILICALRASLSRKLILCILNQINLTFQHLILSFQFIVLILNIICLILSLDILLFNIATRAFNSKLITLIPTYQVHWILLKFFNHLTCVQRMVSLSFYCLILEVVL